jgi:membrane-bound serine protease (ClpP class)
MATARLFYVVTMACLVFCISAASTRCAEDRPRLVLQARLDDQPITPGTAQYLRRALREAERRDAECLVLMLDTPGGLLDATRQIVKDVLASRTPVVVYVAPSGGRAASAGVFITLAAHVAAMAPGTTIGAAHPVQVGGLPIQPPAKEDSEQESSEGNGEDTRGAMEQKMVNDTVAWARALAQRRGRDAQWAAQAVSESVSLTASEAAKQGAVDLQAANIGNLLQEINGRVVQLPQGDRTLSLGDVEIVELRMWWGEQVLAALSTPNVAFLLMIFVEQRAPHAHN